MDKRGISILIVLVLVLISFQLISAVEISSSPSYKSGETLLVKISGNFIKPILKDNVFFYKGYVRVPMEYDVGKLNDEYYIYASLPQVENTTAYSIQIKNVQYYKGTKTTEEDIIIPFNVTAELVDFTLIPGFVNFNTKDSEYNGVNTENNKEFSLKVQNLQDKKITISISLENLTIDSLSGETIELRSGEIKELRFSSDVKRNEFGKILVSSEATSYEVPVFILASGNETVVQTKGDIEFSNTVINSEFVKGTQETKIFYIYNIGENTVYNISLVVSEELKPFLDLSAAEIPQIAAGDRARVYLYFSAPEVLQRQGAIEVSQGNVKTYIDVSLNSVSDSSLITNPVNNSADIPLGEKSCSELQGKFCTADEVCSGEIKALFEGRCCVGQCLAKQPDTPSGGSTTKIIGWLIIVILIVALIWFFLKKYKGASHPVNLMKVARGE